VPLPSAGVRKIISHKLQQLSVSTPLRDTDFEFDWRRLWSALQETWTALSVLKVSGMANAMEEMFAYLLSYTGLQRLEITDIESQEKEDGVSLIFWREIIPHHRDSLTMLSIEDGFEGGWCYGPRAAALRRCSLLRDLTIPVCRVESSWAETILARARKYKQIEFRDLVEPDGAAVYVLLTMGALDLLLPALQLFSTNSIIVLDMDTFRSEHAIRQTRTKGYLW
jgi:hypothetical protein